MSNNFALDNLRGPLYAGFKIVSNNLFTGPSALPAHPVVF